MSELPDLPARPRRPGPLPAAGAEAAMRSGRRRRMRVLTVAGGVLVGLGLAAAAVVLPGAGPDSLSTADPPEPSTPASTAPSAPPDDSASPSAGPSPRATPAALPARYIAAVDGDLVVDRVPASAPRTLETRYDPLPVDSRGEPGIYLVGVELSPDGSTAYADVCCEPAAGRTERIPLEGARTDDAYVSASSPALSPDGTSLAGFSLDMLVRCALDAPDLRTGCTRLSAHPPEHLVAREALAWSPDGFTLAFVETPIGEDGSGPRAPGSVRVLRAGPDTSVSDGRLLAPPAGKTYAAPVFRGDGMLVVARQDVDPASPSPATGVVLDPADGRVVAEFPLEDRVVDQDYDRAGTYLLTTYRSGRLAWQGGGSRGVLRTRGVTSAAW